MIVRLFVACLAAFLVVPLARAAEPIVLAVVASSPTPAALAVSLVRLLVRAPHALVVQLGDCGDPRPLFALVTEITTPSGSDAALARAKDIAPEAYLKTCTPRAGSLLPLGISAIDPSIATVPANAVNWTDTDRISTAIQLGDLGSFVAVRRHVPAPHDPLEGRQVRVFLARPDGTRVALSENCHDPSALAAAGGLIAFACAREQAGDAVLHDTLVLAADGMKRATFSRCRSPEWLAPGRLRCQAEAVGLDGKLSTTPREETLAR